MTISLETFRLGMQQLAATVFVVTSEHEGKRGGLTATAVCSLSAEPPRLLVSINRRGYTFDLIDASCKLCVNLLDAVQIDVAGAFSSPAAPSAEDRFAVGDWEALETGAPVLVGAVASFDCRVESIVHAGTHAVIIADIVAAHIDQARIPLVYARGRYDQLAGHSSVSLAR